MAPDLKHSLSLVAALGAAVLAGACGDDPKNGTQRIPDGVDAGREEAGGGGGGSASKPLPPPPPVGAGGGSTDAGGDGAGPVIPTERCDPVESSEPLPARASVMSDEISRGPQLVFTADLFNTFASYCGGCHVESTREGAFEETRVNRGNFAELVTEETLDQIRKSDPEEFMPPPEAGGIPWDERLEDDPVRQMVRLLELWFEAGKPGVSFELPKSVEQTERPYLFSSELGESLTNIGNCLPDKSILGTDVETMDAMDALFASLADFRELPERLMDTDLDTFDSAILATRNVFAFAPAYPLFSDNAAKIRYVRVPRGEDISYDETTREFDIPDNTRFYKTFLKKVTDNEGRKSYRKIETRLIVVRRDDCSTAPCRLNSIMATYAWDEDETLGARLVTTPLRNGEPFIDNVITYAEDEAEFAKLLESGAPTATELRSVTRHYAIPGSERCAQCHMGSMSRTGILGFTPLQTKRWPYVEEADMHAHGDELKGFGILADHAPEGDEVDQLERLIDYGVVTGLEVDDVVSLRASQDEASRNGYELVAQGYMTGNCAHCHNPRGFPTVQNPELGPLLDFYPRPAGGVFGFPLDRFSPRIRRTRDQNVSIPYLTPSLYDYRYDEGQIDVISGAGEGGVTKKAYLTPEGDEYVLAPWRSFIYRNVDTPFTYVDDLAVFPHMPLNVAGFDCRLPGIMGNWMVSLPARAKAVERMPEPGVADEDPEAHKALAQPYEEVGVEDADYDEAVELAKARVGRYQESIRYEYCPDTSDIQDPDVLDGVVQTPAPEPVHPHPDRQPPFPGFTGNVPGRPHWAVTDRTEVPGAWEPRRPDWGDIILPDSDATLTDAQRTVVDALQSLELTGEFRTFATTPVPYGFWLPKPECDGLPSLLSTLETGNPPTWTGVSPPQWTVQARPDTVEPLVLTREEMQARLYTASPGAAIFHAICSNCHGINADGDSLNANTIADMTGGSTRVANLRDGIFGPPGSPGMARRRIFEEAAAELGVDIDDMAVRYVAWMALGGTEKFIPPAILYPIANNDVLGVSRSSRVSSSQASPNMLEQARTLCSAALGTASRRNSQFDAFLGFRAEELGLQVLIRTNGDEAMWQRVCAAGRPTPILAVSLSIAKTWQHGFVEMAPFTDGRNGTDDDHPLILSAEAYGDAPVMTLAETTYALDANPSLQDKPARRGVVIKSASSLDPLREPVAWCIYRDPDDLARRELVEQLAVENAIDGQPLPLCPDPIVPGENAWTKAEVEAWALRGAMNAGMAVFSYLDAVAKGEAERIVRYNECDLVQSGN